MACPVAAYSQQPNGVYGIEEALISGVNLLIWIHKIKNNVFIRIPRC